MVAHLIDGVLSISHLALVSHIFFFCQGGNFEIVFADIVTANKLQSRLKQALKQRGKMRKVQIKNKTEKWELPITTDKKKYET